MVMAELGAVLLLFQVGLESTPKEMMAVGGRAALVAVVGVVTPMLLGFGVGELMRPQEPWMLHAFLGAMLAATSVGITARVLKDANALRAPFARIILGAAVIDDVLGLLVLAVRLGHHHCRCHRDGAVRGFRGLDRGEGVRVPGRGAARWIADLPAAVPGRARTPEPWRGLGALSRASASSCPTSPSERASRPSWAPSRPASSWRTCISRTTCSEASRPCTRA